MLLVFLGYFKHEVTDWKPLQYYVTKQGYVLKLLKAAFLKTNLAYK